MDIMAWFVNRSDTHRKLGKLLLILLLAHGIIVLRLALSDVGSIGLLTKLKVNATQDERIQEGRRKSLVCVDASSSKGVSGTAKVESTREHPWVVRAPTRNTSARTQGMFHYLNNFKNPCWYTNSERRKMLSCLPYVYVLGMAKSGTTTLCTCLEFHQDVLAPLAKELGYWKTDSKGPDVRDYLPQFSLISKQILWKTRFNGQMKYHPGITYDGTPSYVWNIPELPRILHKINPRQKLIITMRNPTDRLFSHYHHVCLRLDRKFTPEDFHNHVERDINAIEACRKQRHIKDCVVDSASSEISVGLSVYYIYAQAWLEVFPTNQILFIKAEDMFSNASLVLDGVFDFLGLRKASERTKRLIEAQTLDHVPPAFGIWANKELPNIDYVKDKHVLHDARTKWTAYRQQMLPRTRLRLDMFYAPFNKLLAELLADNRFMFQRETIS